MNKYAYIFIGTLLVAAPAYAQTLGAHTGLTANADATIQATQTLNADITAPASATATVTVQGSGSVDVSNSSSTVTAVAIQTAASGAVNGDTQVSHIALASTSVSMTYPVRARLFGIFPMTLSAEAQVNANGAVELHYPWYSFLFATDQAAVQTKLQTVGTAASAYATGTFTAEQQLALLSLIHAALKSSFDSSTTASATVQ